MSKTGELVENVEEVLENLTTLERYSRSADKSEHDFYKGMIARGAAFVVTGHNASYRIGPSRFVGYAQNTAVAHYYIDGLHGGITNTRLQKLSGRKWEHDKEEEKAFLRHCAKMGIEPLAKTRRYIRFDTPALTTRNTLWPAINKPAEEDIFDIENRRDLKPTQKQTLINARRGQGHFRTSLCKVWSNRCAISGCTVLEVLKASHIKPWAISTDKERLDPYNGLLLMPNVDALFDKGLISFDDNGKILFSRALNKAEAAKLGITPSCRTKFTAKHIPYIRCHRDLVFQQ